MSLHSLIHLVADEIPRAQSDAHNGLTAGERAKLQRRTNILKEALTELRRCYERNPMPKNGWTLRDLRAANVIRAKEWSGDCDVGLLFRSNELCGEVGEAANVVKKIERERRGWAGSRATLNDLGRELGDVVICADLTAMEAGIDLMDFVRQKFNETSDKLHLKTHLAQP